MRGGRGAAGTVGRWVAGLAGGLLVWLAGLAVAQQGLRAQSATGASRDPRYSNITCENGGRTGIGDYTDAEGRVHQIWFENYGFRTGNPDSPGGWFEMGKSGPWSQLPADHRVSGAFDDMSHSLNGEKHSPQEDLDHAHAFNMVQGLLNICVNTEN